MFHKFLRPRAMVAKGVDYGYTEFEKSRKLDISADADESFEKISLFLETDIFATIHAKTSPERLRRERKTCFDALMCCLIKHPAIGGDVELQKQIFSKFDVARAKEVKDRTDTDYSSIHHVLHGLITCSDDYVIEPWYNDQSKFNYLCFVEPAMEMLQLRYSIG
jgi:hypothetical protein